jgi:hypothetical protein
VFGSGRRRADQDRDAEPTRGYNAKVEIAPVERRMLRIEAETIEFRGG